MDLAVVIVTWNTRDLIGDALRTLQKDLAQSGLSSTVWVVDNDSADGTADVVRDHFPDVNLIASQQNLGFGAGNNLALREIGFGSDKTTADLPNAVFLLNPDTLVHSGAVRTLYDALFSAPDVGLAGARLTYEDGSFQHSAFGFPGIWQTAIDLLPMPGRLYESMLNGRYDHSLFSGTQPFPVDMVLGATMMLRREVIEQTGMFDQQFFMYCEEVDWAMRIRQAGWRVLCVPTAHITHLEGKSTGLVKPASYLNLWRSRFQLYEKHYASWRVVLIRGIVRLGMRRKINALDDDNSLADEAREALREAYQAVAAL